jgi:hypothetical protein
VDGPNYEICSDFIDVVVDMNHLYGFIVVVNDTNVLVMGDGELWNKNRIDLNNEMD